MTQQEALRCVGERITPILNEFGLESYVMMGYMRCDDKLERFLALAIKREEVSQVDAMRQVAAFGMAWASPDTQPQPPT